ncbi:hypothetical protein IFT95_19630 [Pantoea agglomerans]|uniref:hypothetical protein n=1 Tax=Enterobacter agglomerans TaxID=549 RepID=UPI00177EC23E|nr:hypothetical protein [Pantoea agglomerans]MBD8244381.1 hypothetical protein [Pantoea agglomerans]
MTEEQKQALIEWLKEGIELREEYGFNGNLLASMRVALATLTAPPVKLPKRHSMLWKPDFREGYKSCMAFRADEVIAAIRAAGYRVEDE